MTRTSCSGKEEEENEEAATSYCYFKEERKKTPKKTLKFFFFQADNMFSLHSRLVLGEFAACLSNSDWST